ncbi:MAG: sodium:solute symporter family protein [Ignavibacteriota bacterium]|nr:sodium:solute symporter family protein [Ignavibacteriota bacterium]MCO6446870.1 sodium:solute symporter family protein [Ignavibacterium album]MDX9712034.1 sodium:solute symporter family protein [Ignavibacteriaceae bacterium]MEB2355314.1 sodium:solute symporter family protein [Ignavibacteriales bacterium]QKJ99310.1 MAG: sodium:solute symporter family protein [Ignavibacteriota bacterium]
MITADYIIVFVFLAAMFYIGSIFYKWVGSSDDFYLAGRQLTPFILAAVLAATNVNLYSFVGQAGIAYKEGIPIIWQTWTGNMAMVISGLFVIPIFRRLRIRTIPEFLEKRYSKGVRTFVAFIWILRLTFWLGVVLYTAVIAAQTISGLTSFTAWVLIFSVVVVIYTILGGMWSVAFTDVIQFVLMLAGALLLLPLAMSAVGWFPGMSAKLPEGALTLVKETGTYNWRFVIAIFLLGIEWACVDQGLLQRAFGAESTRSVAKGLVLAGIITTPFALLWNLPGLAARIIYPNLANADSAVPILIANLIPNIVLGFVVIGLLSSQLSTISGNLNGVATIFASDIYENVINRKATDKDVLRIARIITLITGFGMILFAYLVPILGGAVNAYLTIIAIMDMPLFVIAVVYGLLWKRVNWQGAVTGYILGAISGIIGQFFFDLDFNLTTFITAGTTLIFTPLVSLFTKEVSNEKIEAIWRARTISDEEIESNNVYNILPKTFKGKLSLLVFFSGLIVFLVGVFMGSSGSSAASIVAVTGMVIYFIGGLFRTYTN